MQAKDRRTKLIRLNANENFYGCSSAVYKAIRKDVRKVHLYPGIPCRLEEKLAEQLGVNLKRIVVGAGSVRLIDGIIQTFVEPAEEIIIFERSFVAYEQLASAHRRKYFLAKQINFVCDVQSIFPLLTPHTKVIFIANPNNPTGTVITHLQLENLLKNIAEKILVVIDEAYCEYVTDMGFPDSVKLQKKYPNLVILRTFSKIYGLAGLRIGYGIAEDKIALSLKRSRIPFFFNALSEDAAIAALEDKKFIDACAKRNAKERDFLFENLIKSGMNVLASQGNFLFLQFENENHKEKIFKKLINVHLLVCNLKVFGQEKSLRITIGDREVCKKIISVCF